MEKAITIFLFFLFSVAVSFGQTARIQFTNDIAITFLDIVVGVTFLYFIVSHRQFFFRNISREKKAVSFFIIACTFSLMANVSFYKKEEFFVAVLYLIRWTAYASLFFVAQNFSQKLRLLASFFITASGFFIVFAGYVQYFFYPSLRNLYYLGWDEHLYRMFSTFFDPNFAGSFFVLYAVFVLYQFLYGDKKYKWIFLAACILSVGAVFLSFSRSAIIMLFVCSFIFLSMKFSKRITLTILTAFALMPLLLSNILKSEGTNLFRTASSISRIESQQNAIKIIVNNPVLGIGFNAYRYAQERYGFIRKESAFPDHSGAGTDNSYLFVLATTGVVGFLAYVNLWRVLLLSNKRNVLVIASLGGLFVNAFFLNSLFYPMIMAWVWILLGITARR